MKIIRTLIFSLLWAMVMPSYGFTSLRGGDSDHGGGSFRLNLKALSSDQLSVLAPLDEGNPIKVLARDCSIIHFKRSSAQPFGRYLLVSSKSIAVDLISPRTFDLASDDIQELIKIPNSDLNSYPLKDRALHIDEAAKVKNIIRQLLSELEHPDYGDRFTWAMKRELQNLQLRIVSEDCFYLQNSRHFGDYTPISDDELIGVYAFTQNAPNSVIYISEKRWNSLTAHDLARVIAGEVIHHLPLGPYAGDEGLVHSIAEALVFGRESLDARAIWFSEEPKLLLAMILGPSLEKLGVAVEPNSSEESPIPSEEEIDGSLPPAILQLRQFLHSKSIQDQADSIIDDFNDLFGRVKIEGMLACRMSYWMYAGVALDQQNGKFDYNKPNESEATLMVLRNYDHRFCILWNNLFGSSNPEAEGYGTSSFLGAEKVCQWEPSKAFNVDKEVLLSIPKLKRQKLKALNKKINVFNDSLCKGFKVWYGQLGSQGQLLQKEIGK